MTILHHWQKWRWDGCWPIALLSSLQRLPVRPLMMVRMSQSSCSMANSIASALFPRTQPIPDRLSLGAQDHT